MAANNPLIQQYLQGLLGNQYQTPMQGGLMGAAGAMGPLAGVRNRKVGMGEALAAAAGGAQQGMQQSQMQNMMMGSNVQQMQQGQAEQATARQATFRLQNVDAAFPRTTEDDACAADIAE